MLNMHEIIITVLKSQFLNKDILKITLACSIGNTSMGKVLEREMLFFNSKSTLDLLKGKFNF